MLEIGAAAQAAQQKTGIKRGTVAFHHSSWLNRNGSQIFNGWKAEALITCPNWEGDRLQLNRSAWPGFQTSRMNILFFNFSSKSFLSLKIKQCYVNRR